MLELVAVIALVALLFTAAGLSVQNVTGAQLKRDAFVLAANIGAIHTAAVTKNAYLRLVIDLEAGTYATEIADTRFFLGKGKEEDDKPLFKKKDRDLLKAGQVQFLEDAEGPKMHYAQATELKDNLLRTVKLSRGVSFTGVMTTHQREERKEGKAFVYFFPNGFVERAVIYVTDGSRSFTLLTQPLTGRVKVAAGREDVPRGFDKEEEYSGHF
jgi:general secretion pathway protein H